MKLFISLKWKAVGGGANTFAYNFVKWAEKNRGDKFVRSILHADKAIIIADKANVTNVQNAKNNGCFIIHRLDEYFEQNESKYRREKHKKILELNKFADVTIYQSEFVYNNVHPYLKPAQYKIILNGADPELFYPSPKIGGYIGHVSWSSDERKRFDLLWNLIETHPEKEFLLVGNHNKTKFPFHYFKNVISIGTMPRKKMRKYYHMMKLLYLPSEKDPCPNTAAEAILCGVPVCYNPMAGTKEIVQDCGETLEDVNKLLCNLKKYRNCCFNRTDLHFEKVFEKYLNA